MEEEKTVILNDKFVQNDNNIINDNELGKQVSQSNTLEEVEPEQSYATVTATVAVTDGDEGVVRDEIVTADVADVKIGDETVTDEVVGVEIGDETVTADVAGVEDTDTHCSPVIESETETVKMEVDADVSKDGDGEGEEVVTDVKNDGENIENEEGKEAGVNEELVNEHGIVADEEEAGGVDVEKSVGAAENDDNNDDDDDDEEVTMEKLSDSDEEEDTTVSSDEEKVPVKRRGRGRGRKRKRGGKSVKVTPKPTVEEEDVCFICFDGGNLVLCDNKDCPKAYHPSCVKRDEAFFQTKGKWNCGWHLCSICQKRAEFMCYTCTFSLCKTCIKTSVLYRVREKEKKGFCDTCMKTVMLIENSSQENQGNVDFDDKTSWEYFFKEYWTDVKAKHHFSLAELVEAKNARKGSEPAGKQEQPAEHSDDGSGSENPSEKLESQPKETRKRKSRKQKAADYDAIAYEGTSVPENTKWASKELLEFVMHMGYDESYQSQFDVQAMLLEYIKTNTLRDSRRKSQIICDARLQRLFGKPRVGHFEMLKLLESHFLLQEDDNIQGSVVDTEVSPVDDDERGVKDKKRKIRKKGDREPQSNRKDYATIDIHNISIIYLKRKLVEDFLDDTETFHSKVVGSFVRIRISGANHKNDLYRLVQVTGTTKGEHYAVGKTMTDTMLEILNLDKTESISIDTISNLDFTEDECKRLRLSIKCGLINRPTVGNILDKAIQLQPARVNDRLEKEVVRLSHLRDRASDLGRKKELRECVQKLELLKTPEERARRVQDIPVIHDDPTMDPKYESEEDKNEDDKKQDMYKSSVDSRFSERQDYPSKETRRDTGTSRSHGNNHEFTRNLSNNNFSNKVEDATSPHFKPFSEDLSFVQQPSVLNKQSSPNETKDVSEGGLQFSETEKMWHYKDPSGKIQGPFTMAQLRKWNNSKFFPVGLKIWRKSEKEGDGILLTQALEGWFITRLPYPTPKQSLGHVTPPVARSSYHNGNEGLHSPTPSSSQVAGNSQMVQSLVNQNQNYHAGSYGWSGGQSHNSQPSPSSNQWRSAQNIVQNPQPQPNLSWPTPGNENKTWGPQLSVNVKPPSRGLQADSGWVSPQPPQVVTPNQGWAAGNGNRKNSNQGWGSPTENSNQGWGSPAVKINQGSGSPTDNSNQGWGSPAVNSNQGWGSPAVNSNQGRRSPAVKINQGSGSPTDNSNQGWGSPAVNSNQGRRSSTPRDRHQPYNRRGFSGEKSSRGRSSGFHDDRKHRDKPRSSGNRGRPRNSDRFSDRSRGYD